MRTKLSTQRYWLAWTVAHLALMASPSRAEEPAVYLDPDEPVSQADAELEPPLPEENETADGDATDRDATAEYEDEASLPPLPADLEEYLPEAGETGAGLDADAADEAASQVREERSGSDPIEPKLTEPRFEDAKSEGSARPQAEDSSYSVVPTYDASDLDIPEVEPWQPIERMAAVDGRQPPLTAETKGKERTKTRWFRRDDSKLVKKSAAEPTQTASTGRSTFWNPLAKLPLTVRHASHQSSQPIVKSTEEIAPGEPVASPPPAPTAPPALTASPVEPVPVTPSVPRPSVASSGVPSSGYHCPNGCNPPVQRIKDHMRRSHWGYPEYFEELPMGYSVRTSLDRQIERGRAARLMLHHMDFHPQSTARAGQLTVHGQARLRRLAEKSLQRGMPIGIELVNDNEGLNAARRESVLAYSETAGLGLTADMIVSREEPHRIEASEALLIQNNLLKQTQSGGGLSDTGGSSGSSLGLGGGSGGGAGSGGGSGSGN